MNRYEAKYHAVTFVSRLIDDFINESEKKYPVLDVSARKIMRELIVIQRRTQTHANRLSRGFEDFKEVDIMRRE